MSSPVIGAGYLISNDRLTDAAFCLIQPSVNTAVPAGGIGSGVQIVPVWDPSMYVGAQIVVGAAGSSDIEVVTISIVLPGTSFSAVFQNAHVAGEPITGATFPVRNPVDQLFTQAEMLGYLSTALNDFLTDVPLLYEVADITVPPTSQYTPLPDDCMFPVRVAWKNYPLRETSQDNLSSYNWNWTQQGLAQPFAYFRDKIPLQNVGVYPRAGNTIDLEVVYAQRGAQSLGLADGFPLPDPFTLPILHRTLSFAFSKDGEIKSPALAKLFDQRYQLGVKVSKMFLDAMQDSNVEA